MSKNMSKTMIDKMVDRFLGWKLPKDFSPDAGISFDRTKNGYINGIFTTSIEKTQQDWPIGTNLLTADQAREMIQHMLSGVVPPEVAATEGEGEAYMHGYYDGVDAATLKVNGG